MKIFPLLVLSLNFLLVTKTNGLVLDRSKRQAIDRKDDLETGLATIKLTTTTGISCGGFYVFAQICKENGISKKIALKVWVSTQPVCFSRILPSCFSLLDNTPN